MKKLVLLFAIASFGVSAFTQVAGIKKEGNTMTISKEVLKDKIKGAWAAQTIGVTFGVPSEFKYNSTMIRDYHKLAWNDSSMEVEYRERPGTYDDVYMDLTFMQVIEDHGMDAPAQTFADALAHGDYKLWFANQTARYNILNGLKPPESGYWLNNPCADDIDFQIEADFAGIMSPGMINSAVKICDKVGHIMNYGDGYYGGVFMAGLYSLALVSSEVSDIEPIIREALSAIPPESKFYQCVNDVVNWYDENPDDWKTNWDKTNRKWASDIGSPLGVFEPFDIDAKINAAHVVTGLLYGHGDFTRTYEIATRCGDDADCNPGSAGGVLAAILGFKKVPEFWTQGLSKVENIPFMGTKISLLGAYDMSFRHAEKMILRNGGKVEGNDVVINLQKPETVPLEVAFKGHYPVARIVPKQTKNEISFEFEGIGFALAGPPNIKDYGARNHVFNTEMYIDGKLVEKVKLPTATNERRFTPFWKYQLPRGKHNVVIKILNPVDYAGIQLEYAVIYDDKPYEIKF